MKSFLKRSIIIIMVLSLINSSLAMNGSVNIIKNVSAATTKKIIINKSIKIKAGQKKKLTVKFKPAKSKAKLIWKSKKPKIASVNSKGVVTGKKKGKTVITATVKSAKKISAKCKVTVKGTAAATKVTASPASNTANPAVTSPSEGQTVSPSPDPQGTVAPTGTPKPRVIITTDGEFDDVNSFIHYILYANNMDFAGIVQTSSYYHWRGNSETGQQGMYGSGKTPNRWPGTEWAYNIIDAYEEVYPNLLVHDPGYPEPDYLRSIYKVGNVDYEGEMDGPTEGSDLIKDCILDDDPRTLFIQCWGGINTLAMALTQIEDEYKYTDSWSDIYDKVTNKVIITACSKQDKTYDNYVAKVWPDIPFIDAECQKAYGYATKDQGSDEMKRCLSSDWMYENIETGHGPILDRYLTWGDGTRLDYEPDSMQYGSNDNLLNNPNAISWVGKGYNRYDFLSEGDSNTFFNLLDFGLSAFTLEEFTYGGYAGRYAKKAVTETDPNSWTLQNDNDNVLGLKGSYPSVMKWIPDIHHDFAARADWCITSNYEDANHRPDISIEEGTAINASAGDTIELHANVSDPDNDNVSVSWWNYQEAGTYKASKALEVEGADTDTATFTIPNDAKSGDTIHIIARAEDDGEHNLVYYQRVIITVD